MDDGGGFSYTFDVPPQAAAGDAAVVAAPYAIDWCDDTGRNNRAHRPTEFLERTSCAVPIQILSITG
jgi:hypothetical protein